MKILHINKYYYIKGGSDSVFFNTEKLLTKNGHFVIPFCIKNKKNIFSKYEKYFVDYPELSESSFFEKIKNLFSFFYNRESKRKIEEIIINERPDIAHIHLLFNGISVSVLPVLKKYNIPIVMTLHDYRLVCPAYTFMNGKQEICEKCEKGKYYNCILNKCALNGGLMSSIMLTIDILFRNIFISPFKYINEFLFVSNFSMLKHQEFLPRKVFSSTFLYNFYPEKIATVPFEEVIINKNKSYFLFYGRISKEKGIKCLIDAMKKLPTIDFLILGSGPLSYLFENVASNIKYLGYKTGNELFEYVKSAKCTIIPSEWYENNPLTIIESLSLGTPVIGSNIGGIPELIRNGENGFLFSKGNSSDLAEKITEMNNLSLKEYCKFVENSINFANSNFDQNLYYNKLIGIYSSLINKK